MVKSFLLLITFLLFNINMIAGDVKVGEKVPEFQLTDFYNNIYKLTDYKGKWIVLEWVNYDCPFVANRYKSGLMHELQKKYIEKGITWLSVAAAAKGEDGYYDQYTVYDKMRELNAMPSAYLLDTNKQVAKLLGITKTPQIAIINPDGVLVYIGAIDDSNSDSTEEFSGATNYIDKVFDALLNAKQKEVKDSTNIFKPFATEPFGCSIESK